MTHKRPEDIEKLLGPDRLAYRVEEAAIVTGIGESTLWGKIAEGKLRAKRDGRKMTLILRDELLRYLRDLPDAPASKARAA